MKYRSQDRGRGLQVQEDRLHRHQAHLQVRRLQVHQTHQEDERLQVLLVRLLHHPILIMKVDQKIEVKNLKNFVAMSICEKMSISI